MRFVLLAWLVMSSLLTGCASLNNDADIQFATVRPTYSKPLPMKTGSIYKSGYEIKLFEDTKAKHVGDILTVILQENTNASKSASTTTSKDGEVDVGIPTFLGRGITKGGVNILDTQLDAQRAFAGQGDSSQSNSLSGTISVTISEVLANGNLVVRGEKMLSLNQGKEHIRLSGIVRPGDITPDNTVRSSQLANAKIIYGGEGVIAESNKKGWLQRITDSAWWPF
ncbi:MAG: flagellar basal body L-ring protein FlgH [Gammaproteobacteria bacterium]|nr:flagellar basal body L-ring protein FlgH [Gammaproteobacteria bacterium]MDH5800529.1 flagellar basal body L-ring protein FlgH [Gammaproteobacteria bacterium]